MHQEFYHIIDTYKQAGIKFPDQWLDDKKVEFIYNSNKLEGNHLRLADTKSIIDDKMNFSNDVRFKDILEVKGHIKALDNCVFMAKNNYPLTQKTLQLCNSELLSALWKFDEYYASWKENKQELGQYKTINNKIKFTLDSEDGIIEPTSNSETVANNMNAVFDDNAAIKTVLEKVAHMAFQIWINQPFADGNKRTARLAVAYLLMLEGLPLISFKAEGYHFNEGLLRSYKEKKLTPLMNVIETEVKQQLTQIMELDKKLKTNQTPPKLGFGGSLLF